MDNDRDLHMILLHLLYMLCDLVKYIKTIWFNKLVIKVVYYLFIYHMLTRTIKRAFSFNIMNTLKELKDAVKAPLKHIKAATEPAGNYYSVQTNTTEEAFD